jgi:predicted AAA+ superfamily ATPase
VSLSDLLSGEADIEGETLIRLADYVEDIVASGFPGIRAMPARARRLQLDGYITRIVERDFPEQGLRIRRPQTLRGWLSAYAAATATTASYSAILDAATPGESDKPAKNSTVAYRDVLAQLWLLDPVPAWEPHNAFTRLGTVSKHFLADPALSARLLGLDEDRLLRGVGDVDSIGPQEKTQLGALFEALVALSLMTYAQAADAQLSHLRTSRGDHEIDFVVRRNDGATVAAEVKLARTVSDADVKHLHWLRQKLGDELREMIVIYSGEYAYRRRDGVAVIPLALLGP